jgi:hypothetical protein
MPAATSTSTSDITWTTINMTDGVQTSISYQGGSTTQTFTGVPMDFGKEITQTIDTTGKKTTYTTNNNGKYYVLRLVGTKPNGEKDISVAAGYITKTTSTVNGTSSTSYSFTPISIN